jgi:hypothetical protein
MANTKISALPAATTPVAGTAQIPIVQAGATKVATAADIRNTPEPFVMTAQATGSVTPAAADTIKMFSRSYSGRVMPEFVGESGVDCFLQPSLINNNLMLWQPTVGAVGGTIIGNTFTSVGTASNPPLASTNMQTAMRRTNWLTTASTATTTCGIRGNVAQVWRGNAANLGGFHAFFRFSQNTNLLGHQTFIGLAASLVVLGGDPSALGDMIGIGYDGTDPIANGWQVMRNDATGAATKVSLGSLAPRDTSTVLDLSLYAPANASFIGVRVYNQSTQTVALDNTIYTTDLPTNTVFLNFHVQTRVGTAGANQNLQLNRIYIESDI